MSPFTKINISTCIQIGALVVLMATPACFTGLRPSNDKAIPGSDEVQYGGTEDSGGVLNPLQARFDVQHIELELKISPASKSIQGSATLKLLAIESLDEILLDLDSRLTISEVRMSVVGGGFVPSRFRHTHGGLHIYPSLTLPSQSLVSVGVDYEGKPRVAEKAPWDGGFTVSFRQGCKTS